MSIWWDSLDMIMKVLYCIAIPATLIFVIQLILSFIGGADSGSGIDFSDTTGLDMGGVDFDASDVSFDGASGMDFNDAPTLGEVADGTDLDSHMILDGGNPHDFSIMRMFTLQGIVAFFTVFGWTAIVSINTGMMEAMAVAIGILFGFIAMFGVAKLFFLSRKLVENGTLDLRNAIGISGKVYIPIPGENQGEGKVNLHVQGRFMEFSAVTMGEKPLPTGAPIRVVDLRGDTLVVEEDK